MLHKYRLLVCAGGLSGQKGKKQTAGQIAVVMHGVLYGAICSIINVSCNIKPNEVTIPIEVVFTEIDAPHHP